MDNIDTRRDNDAIERLAASVKQDFWKDAFNAAKAEAIMGSREELAALQIWVNQDVEIYEGVGYLLVTEGAYMAKSHGARLHVKCFNSSELKCESFGASAIAIEGHNSARIWATGNDSSKLGITAKDTAQMYIMGWIRQISTPRASGRQG